MKFDRRPRYDGFSWTERKLASAQSHGDRVRSRAQARYPLFAEQLEAPPAFDADTEALLREERTRAGEQRMRDLQARIWREARRDASAASAEQQDAIREGWQAWRGPRNAFYFRYMVDLHTGVMVERCRVFGEQQLAARREFIRSLRAQEAFDFRDTSTSANDLD